MFRKNRFDWLPDDHILEGNGRMAIQSLTSGTFQNAKKVLETCASIKDDACKPIPIHQSS